MNNSIIKYRTLSLALAFTGFIIASNLVVAQEDAVEIIVRAPIDRMEPNAVKTETIELNRYVSVAGLDLAKHADVGKLDERIAAVAKESCEKLSDMFPLARSNPSEMARCVKKAIESTEDLKDMAIAAAN